MSRPKLLFLALAAVLVVSRLCHVAILWEGDTLPLATAQQMAHGKTIYRDIWFDKPPLLPLAYLLWGARPGWPLRLGDALYCLLACWIAYRFARDLWTEREGLWAAALLGVFLVFDFPSSVIPVASDLMMLAPHVAAVWMTWKRRPFSSGLLAAVAFWISPKGVYVAAVCLLWNPSGALPLAAGFGVASALAVLGLASVGALGPYWEEVWKWGRLYAGSTFVADPVRNGAVRTLNWLGFHAAIVIAAGRFLWDFRRPSEKQSPAQQAEQPPHVGQASACGGSSDRLFEAPRILHWLVWLSISLVGLATGLRFFPRYYFILLPVVVLMAARGFTRLGRSREFVALLLLIPATRFGPAYLTAMRNHNWRDVSMDRESRAAADFTRQLAKPGDTLFIWGYRPEIYPYTGLVAGTLFLDSQPLTGVPADRHLTQSEPVETVAAGQRRLELTRTAPTFVLDGLGPYNPKLAITNYPELREWLSHYQEMGRPGQTVVYRRRPE